MELLPSILATEETWGTVEAIAVPPGYADGLVAEVALMVEAYRDGTTTRAEVAASLGLTTAQHDAARKRLDRLCQRLPEAVLDGVRQVFGINLRIRSGQ